MPPHQADRHRPRRVIESIDRDDERTWVQMLYPTIPHHAEVRQASPACPTPAAPRQPLGLRSDAIKMPSVTNPRLSLDRDLQSGRSERHRIDIATTAPSQRMPQPPALRLQRCDRALDGVLRARPDPTPASEREPVARVEMQPDGREEQQPVERRRSRARDHEPEQPGDDASQRRPSSVREPAAGDARSSRGDRLELIATAERALALALGWLNHCLDRPTGARRSA